MKCPLCGKDMSRMDSPPTNLPRTEAVNPDEPLYYCGRHGVMNKPTDIKDKVDRITKKA